MNHKPVLKAKKNTGYGAGTHQQATVHITADNVTLVGLVIHEIEDYSGWLKVVEITDANNAEIRDCELKSATDDVASIYLSGSQIGKYIIENNELDGGIVPANGAGNGGGGENSLIKGNHIGASISFTGKTNTGWDLTSFSVYPTITGNYIGGLDLNDGSRLLINSRDLDSENLISDEVMAQIQENNEFPDGLVAVIEDVYDYSGEQTHRKRLMLNPAVAVYNVTSGKGYDTIQNAINCAADADTLKLYDNITIQTDAFMYPSYYAVMISGISLTLDLNGHKLSAAAEATVYIRSGGALTLIDSASGGMIKNTEYYAVGNYGIFTMESGELFSEQSYALYNFNYGGTMYGQAKIEGGTLTGFDRGIANCGILEISGGSISVSATDEDAYDIDNSGKLTFCKDMVLSKLKLKNGDHALGVSSKGTMIIETGVTLSGRGTGSTIEVDEGATVNLNGEGNFYIENVLVPAVNIPGNTFKWDGDKWVADA